MNRFKNISNDAWLAVTISLTAGFVLCGYEFLRSASTVLYKTAYGADKLTIVMALMPLSVIAVLYIYGRLLSLLGTRRTLFVTTLGSAAVIGGCYLAIRSGSSFATAILYLYREAYIVLLIEQYWSFINSTLNETAARKLNGPITGFGSLGAILGGYLVYQLAEPLGTASMLLFAAALLIPAAFLSDLGYKKCGEPKPTPEEKKQTKGHLGLGSLKTSPMLIFLLLIVMSTQVLSAVLGLNFQTVLQEAMPNMDQQTAYQGWFFSVLNGGAAFLQFVIAPLLLSFVPVGLVHLGIPLIQLLAVGALIFTPSLQTSAAAYFLFKAFDYSIFRASKEILYIPLSFDARYRAKELIDVLGYRFGKGGSALFFVFLQRAGLALSGFYSWIAVGAISVWVALIIPIIKYLPKKDARSTIRAKASV